jgi:hypothetical protein
MEPTSLHIEFETEHEEVPEEETVVDAFGALKKGYRNRRLAAGRHGKPKKMTQSNGGSRKKLVSARRGMARRVGVARHKGHGRKG